MFFHRSMSKPVLLIRKWSTGWWSWQRTVFEVRAERREPSRNGDVATVSVTVSRNTYVVHRATVPWAGGSVRTLAEQVSLLPQASQYQEEPEWQPIIERFARLCAGSGSMREVEPEDRMVSSWPCCVTRGIPACQAIWFRPGSFFLCLLFFSRRKSNWTNEMGVWD